MRIILVLGTLLLEHKPGVDTKARQTALLKHKKSLNSRANRSMALVKCDCGYKILLIPDLKAMSKAIEDHVLDHLKKSTDEEETESIRVNLISQVLEKVSEETPTQ